MESKNIIKKPTTGADFTTSGSDTKGKGKKKIIQEINQIKSPGKNYELSLIDFNNEGEAKSKKYISCKNCE